MANQHILDRNAFFIYTLLWTNALYFPSNSCKILCISFIFLWSAILIDCVNIASAMNFLTSSVVENFCKTNFSTFWSDLFIIVLFATEN